MQPNWTTVAAMPGLHNSGNGPSFSLDRLIPGSLDSNGILLSALTPGYVRPNHPSNVLPGSSMQSAPGPYSNQALAYSLHPSFSVSAHQPMEHTIAGRQFQNTSLNPSYQLQFQQPGSVSQSLSLSHSAVPYGQSLSYLPSSLVTAMGNGSLGHVTHGANLHTHSQQAAALTAAMAAAPARTFDPLKHFGALPQNQHIRRNKPMITSKTNLYISGLSESDTDDSVRSLVENIVQPKSCKAMIVNGKCKGSGFIDCASEEDAEKAKAHILECTKADGRKLSVKYAFENEKDVLNVYVRNLPRIGFTKEMLQGLFKEFGDVTSVKLLEGESGFTGIGFVRFATAEQAEKAVERMNESKRIVGDGDKPITCKLADKADPKRRPPPTNLQALAAHAAAVASHLTRSGPSLHNPTSLQSLGQPQHQTAYPQQFPLTTQLVNTLQQTPVVVPNLQQSSVPSHARNVLFPPTILSNGGSGSPSVVPVSFFASIGPNGNNQGTTNPINAYRTTLIGHPPNQTPGIQQNQTSVYVPNYTSGVESNSVRSKSCTNATSINFTGSTSNGTLLQSSHTYPTISHENSTSLNTQTTSQQSFTPTVNSSNTSKVMVLAQTPINRAYQTQTSTSTTLTHPVNTNDYVLPTTCANSQSVLSPNISVACQVSNGQCDNICSTTESENTDLVNVVTSELKLLRTDESSHEHQDTSTEGVNWPNSSKSSQPAVTVPEYIICQNQTIPPTLNFCDPTDALDHVTVCPTEIIEAASTAVVDCAPNSSTDESHIPVLSAPICACTSAGLSNSQTAITSSDLNGSIKPEPKVEMSHKKSNRIDKKRESPSISGPGSRRCSEMNLNEASGNSSQANRRRKVPYSSNAPPKQTQPQNNNDAPSPTKPRDLSANSDVRISTSCSIANPSS